MANATAVNAAQTSTQFQGLFRNVIQVSCTMDFGSLIDAAGETNTIAVPGAALGDIVLGPSFSLDISGLVVSAYVSSAGVVSVRVQNETGGTLDITTGTIKLLVCRPNF